MTPVVFSTMVGFSVVLKVDKFENGTDTLIVCVDSVVSFVSGKDVEEKVLFLLGGNFVSGADVSLE